MAPGKYFRAALCALILLRLAGCRPARPGALRVFAAASLREPFIEIGERFEAAHPGRRVEFHFAGTQVLRAQIEQGAPADVFASADLDHARALRKEHRVGPLVVFTHNRLVVVTPKGEGKVRTLADLARSGVRLVLAGEDVPAGRYAARALAALSASGRYGPDFRARALANVVSRETNVRGVLAKVALGEADAGIVYVTDARTERDAVRAITIPADCNPLAAYPAAVVPATPDRAQAEDFVKFLRSGEGRKILARHGFQP